MNFTKPNEFFEEYNERFPGEWSAVSWEYAAILDLWKSAVEQAGSVEPLSVLAAMKAGGYGRHVFGDARWWGRKLFGLDHALVGNWPVVQIQDGKARIVDYGSIPDWWDKHGDLMIEEMRELRQMWDQRDALQNPAG